MAESTSDDSTNQLAPVSDRAEAEDELALENPRDDEANLIPANFRDEAYFPCFGRLPSEHFIDDYWYSTANGSFYNPTRHWCFFAEIVEVLDLSRLTIVTRDKAGSQVPLTFYLNKEEFDLVYPHVPMMEVGNTIVSLYAHRDYAVMRQMQMETFKVSRIDNPYSVLSACSNNCFSYYYYHCLL